MISLNILAMHTDIMTQQESPNVISLTNSVKDVLDSQLRYVFAFVGSPKRVCTSVGRKYLGLISIIVFPVFC